MTKSRRLPQISSLNFRGEVQEWGVGLEKPLAPCPLSPPSPMVLCAWGCRVEGEGLMVNIVVTPRQCPEGLNCPLTDHGSSRSWGAGTQHCLHWDLPQGSRAVPYTLTPPKPQDWGAKVSCLRTDFPAPTQVTPALLPSAAAHSPLPTPQVASLLPAQRRACRMCDAVPEGGTSRYPGSLRRFVVHRSSHLTLGVHLAGRGQHGEGKQFLILCPDQSPPASVRDLLSFSVLFCFFFP